MKDQSTQNRVHDSKTQYSEDGVILKECYQDAITHTLCYHKSIVIQCRNPISTHIQVKGASSHKNTKLI